VGATGIEVGKDLKGSENQIGIQLSECSYCLAYIQLSLPAKFI
jgi:hypothetical protein